MFPFQVTAFTLGFFLQKITKFRAISFPLHPISFPCAGVFQRTPAQHLFEEACGRDIPLLFNPLLLLLPFSSLMLLFATCWGQCCSIFPPASPGLLLLFSSPFVLQLLIPLLFLLLSAFPQYFFSFSSSFSSSFFSCFSFCFSPSIFSALPPVSSSRVFFFMFLTDKIPALVLLFMTFPLAGYFLIGFPLGSLQAFFSSCRTLQVPFQGLFSSCRARPSFHLSAVNRQVRLR